MSLGHVAFIAPATKISEEDYSHTTHWIAKRKQIRSPRLKGTRYVLESCCADERRGCGPPFLTILARLVSVIRARTFKTLVDPIQDSTRIHHFG
jgi:hypothetical protein